MWVGKLIRPLPYILKFVLLFMLDYIVRLMSWFREVGSVGAQEFI